MSRTEMTPPAGAASHLAALLCAVALAAGCTAPYDREAGEGTSPAETLTEAAGADGASGDAADAPSAAVVDGDYLPAEIATIGWDNLSRAPIVLLRDSASGKVVPIWVGIAEAQAIAAALHEVEMPRPMTHDLLVGLLARLDAEVEELLIHDLVDNTYYALLRLRVAGRDEPLLVDARPSDGMAVALRTGAPIRMARKLVDESPDFEFMAPEGADQVVRALGLTVVAPDAELRDRFGLPQRPGLVVTRAVGEAAESGLRRGDLLLEIGGKAAVQPVDLLDRLRDVAPGERLAVSYWRDGEEHEAALDPRAGDGEERGSGHVA